MPTWVIQIVEEIVMREGKYLAEGKELQFVDQFSNENDLSADLHEGGIAGVAQNNDNQENENDDGDANMDVDTGDPTGTVLENSESHGNIAGVPPEENTVVPPWLDLLGNPVEPPGVAPPENEVDGDVSPPLLPSDYDSNNDSDDGD